MTQAVGSVFIGGSRRVSRLSADVRKRIDRIMEKQMKILLGDANGADKAVQAYLSDCGYALVEIFCSGEMCRNNLGRWNMRNVKPTSSRKDREFYTAKDRVMSEEATYGFMLWDGQSAGTLLNVLRLCRAQKKVVVCIVPRHQFEELRGIEDWNKLTEICAPELVSEVERKAELESPTTRSLVLNRF